MSTADIEASVGSHLQLIGNVLMLHSTGPPGNTAQTADAAGGGGSGRIADSAQPNLKWLLTSSIADCSAHSGLLPDWQALEDNLHRALHRNQPLMGLEKATSRLGGYSAPRVASLWARPRFFRSWLMRSRFSS
jgi:hypothetical protein